MRPAFDHECLEVYQAAIRFVSCAACLDVLTAKRLLVAEQAESGKSMLVSVVRMLASLIDSCQQRMAEDPTEYGIAQVQE